MMAQPEDGYQLSGTIGYPEVEISILISAAGPQEVPALTGYTGVGGMRISSGSEEGVAEACREKLQPSAMGHRQDGRRQGQAGWAELG
jgi:hypothetical protein